MTWIKEWGLIAGLSGLALGVFLMLFREVIRKKIFPMLTKKQGFNVIIVFMLLVWSVAVFSIWIHYSLPDNGNNDSFVERNKDNLIEPVDSQVEPFQSTNDLAISQELTRISKSITFQPGKYSIQDSDRISKRLINFMNTNANINIKIEGHVHNQGQEQLNFTLSQQRAKKLKEVLVIGGINQQRITAIGLGESQPIASNNTSQGRKLNTRIEIIVND